MVHVRVYVPVALRAIENTLPDIDVACTVYVLAVDAGIVTLACTGEPCVASVAVGQAV